MESDEEHGVERLLDIFNCLCSSIEHSPPVVRNIYRTKAIKTAVSLADPPIRIQLSNVLDRNELLKAVALLRKNKNNSKPLTLKHVGFQSDAAIYLNESLTVANHKIFTAAIGLKKKKLIHSVFASHGLVHIKLAQDGKVTTVTSNIQLAKLAEKIPGNVALTGSFRNTE